MNLLVRHASQWSTIVVLLAACNDGVTSVRNTDFEAEESFVYNVDINTQTRVLLMGINGSIEITGDSDATSVTVAGTKLVESESLADATANLEFLNVIVEERASEILVETDQPKDNGGRSFIVHYMIVVPEDMDVLIENVNGAVTARDIAGSVSVANVNGQIRLEDIRGNGTASVVNGQITADARMPLDAILLLSTVNGAIDLEVPANVSADFDASVVNGTISLSNLPLVNPVRTANSLSGRLGGGQGEISLRTVNGTITVIGS
jgi:DUF4097 and DUF4098 domain-containing protein YvlB